MNWTLMNKLEVTLSIMSINISPKINSVNFTITGSGKHSDERFNILRFEQKFVYNSNMQKCRVVPKSWNIKIINDENIETIAFSIGMLKIDDILKYLTMFEFNIEKISDLYLTR